MDEAAARLPPAFFFDALRPLLPRKHIHAFNVDGA
jgi:hypothetical protein